MNCACIYLITVSHISKEIEIHVNRMFCNKGNIPRRENNTFSASLNVIPSIL